MPTENQMESQTDEGRVLKDKAIHGP